MQYSQVWSPVNLRAVHNVKAEERPYDKQALTVMNTPIKFLYTVVDAAAGWLVSSCCRYSSPLEEVHQFMDLCGYRLLSVECGH
jgi:hypothetical protein